MNELTLDLANRLVHIGVEAADVAKSPSAIALCDGGGAVKYLVRMDGASIAAVALAVSKARSAVELGMDTAEVAKQAQPGGDLYGMAHAAGGRYTVLTGGMLLNLGGSVVGAVGVSGGTSEQDQAIAAAIAGSLG